MDSQGFGYKNYCLNNPQHHPGHHGSVIQHPVHHHLNSQTQKQVTGREEFGALDNETLDFSQLEDFITDDSDANGSYFADTLANSEASKHAGGPSPPTPRIVVINNQSQSSGGEQNGFLRRVQEHNGGGAPPCAFSSAQLPHNLPDSPPDSGSEPPYSPADPSPRSPHSKTGVLSGSRNMHDLLIHHPMFPQSSPIVSIGSHELPCIGSPLPHLTPLRGPSLIPITPSPGNPNTSPTTLTTLGPTQSTQILITLGSGQVTQHSNHIETPVPFYTPLQTVNNGENTRSRKRKSSNGGVSSPGGKSSAINVKQEPGPSFSVLSPTDSNSSNNNGNPNNTNGQTDEEYGFDFSGDPSVFLDSNYQCIKFQPFQESTWHVLADEVFKELTMPYYKVDADKGFNFSNSDDAFVCQKKNHFQVTCHARQNGDPKYVKSSEGYKPIDSFFIHFYGVKVESPNQSIKIEQSQSDRSKKPFHPVMVDLSRDQTAKVTVGRLHFNETTSNNMRKKGKPNPDQRYFYLVVALQAHCQDGVYPIVAHASQRIIVRASNPGQFESDMELTWQKGQTTDSVYHAGRVGINTDRPDEALVVYGNCKITGQITHPSDSRAKHDISEVDTKEQLKNVQQLRVVRYKYNPVFARLVGLSEEDAMDTGVIAQEVQKVIPDAVKETGNLELGNGTQIENFLVVNKERIFMENIGAVKELCKVTGKLETRIDQLERITNLKRTEPQLCGSGQQTADTKRRRAPTLSRSSSFTSRSTEFLCSNKFVQSILFVLVIILTLSLIAIATLYILEYQKRSSFDFYHQKLQPSTNISRSNEFQHGDKIQNLDHQSLQTQGYLPSQSRSFIGDPQTKLHGKADKQSWGNSVKNPLRLEASPIPRIKPTVLGRPVKCFKYLTLSPCKIHCCPEQNLDHSSLDIELVERGNQVTSTSGSPATPEVISQEFQNINSTAYGTSLLHVANLMQKNGLEYKRKRRQVNEIPRLLNVPSVHLVSEHINKSLDSSYCVVNSDGFHDCVSTENKYFASANLTYGVPLSKYWDELSISLIFNISSKFDVTQPTVCDKVILEQRCTFTPDAEENKVEAEIVSSSTVVRKFDRNVYSVKIQVGTSPFSKVNLRFSTDLQEENVCLLHPTTSKFFEFNFFFYRVCDE